MRMLSGLMSRWTMLREWACSRAAGDVQGDVDRVADGEPAEAVEQGVGAGAVHVLQDEVVLAGGPVLAGGEVADDVGVVRAGRRSWPRGRSGRRTPGCWRAASDRTLRATWRSSLLVRSRGRRPPCRPRRGGAGCGSRRGRGARAGPRRFELLAPQERGRRCRETPAQARLEGRSGSCRGRSGGRRAARWPGRGRARRGGAGRGRRRAHGLRAQRRGRTCARTGSAPYCETANSAARVSHSLSGMSNPDKWLVCPKFIGFLAGPQIEIGLK